MVMQDVFLFSNTIEDNIAFGNTLANLEQVQMMAEIADAIALFPECPKVMQQLLVNAALAYLVAKNSGFHGPCLNQRSSYFNFR